MVMDSDLKVHGGVIVPMGKDRGGGGLEAALRRLGELPLAHQVQFLSGVIVSLSARIEALEADQKK
jgi:hypothetical protein